VRGDKGGGEKTTALKIRDAQGFALYGRCGKCVGAYGGRYINTQNEKGGERWKRIKQAGNF